MLHKDETLSLNTGDRLALVEDGVWFKIKIILEKNLDGGIMVDRLYSAILNKRSNDEDNNMQVSKKIKLEPEDVCNYCGNSSCEHDKRTNEESNSDKLEGNIPVRSHVCQPDSFRSHIPTTTDNIINTLFYDTPLEIEEEPSNNQNNIPSSSINDSNQTSVPRVIKNKDIYEISTTADNILNTLFNDTLEIEEEPSNYHNNVPSTATNDSNQPSVPCVINHKDINDVPSEGAANYSDQSDAIVNLGSTDQAIKVNKRKEANNVDSTTKQTTLNQSSVTKKRVSFRSPVCEPDSFRNHIPTTADNILNTSNVTTLEIKEEPPEEPSEGTAVNSDHSDEIVHSGLNDQAVNVNIAQIIRDEFTSDPEDNDSDTTVEMEQEPPAPLPLMIKREDIKVEHPIPLPIMIKLEDIKVEHPMPLPIEIKQEEIKVEPGSSNSTIRIKTETDIKEEPEPIDTDNAETNLNVPQAIPANNPVPVLNGRRDRCWYGRQCYRTNPLHKLNLSHPGDPDYDGDNDNDNAEVNQQPCPYGVQCYRRNVLHRRLYKHFGPPAARPQQLTFSLL
uniref:Aprataxin and PNK-like factor n=1 Tax=Diabrotica virgifera virgifera TaxID=50390 RepID=A0A6P7G9N5_DIAVI